MKSYISSTKNIALMLAFLMVLVSCNKKPDLVVPETMPFQTSLKVEYNYVVPYKDGYGNFYINKLYPYQEMQITGGTRNEIYSVKRYSTEVMDTVEIFWNDDLPTLDLLSCHDPVTGFTDSLYCPVKEGELVNIYRFECNIGWEDFQEDLSSVTNTYIQIVNGELTILEEKSEVTPPIGKRKCIPHVSTVVFQRGSYDIQTIADVNNDIDEKNEKNNVLMESEIPDLKAGSN